MNREAKEKSRNWWLAGGLFARVGQKLAGRAAGQRSKLEIGAKVSGGAGRG